MSGTYYQDLTAFVLSMDRTVVTFLVPINLAFALGLTALLSRNRRPLEVVGIATLCLIGCAVASWALIGTFVDVEVMRLEVVGLP